MVQVIASTVSELVDVANTVQEYVVMESLLMKVAEPALESSDE
jgi:hypothetical protein